MCTAMLHTRVTSKIILTFEAQPELGKKNRKSTCDRIKSKRLISKHDRLQYWHSFPIRIPHKKIPRRVEHREDLEKRLADGNRNERTEGKGERK